MKTVKVTLYTNRAPNNSKESLRLKKILGANKMLLISNIFLTNEPLAATVEILTSMSLTTAPSVSLAVRLARLQKREVNSKIRNNKKL